MSATFTYNLILQLAGIINRDFLTYLQKFPYPVAGGAWENFNWYDTVNLWPENFPALLIYETTDDIDITSDEHTFDQSARVLCRVQLSEMDRNVVAQKMRAYLGALALLFGFYDWQRNAYDLSQPVAIPQSLAQFGTTTNGVSATITRIVASRLTFDEFGTQRGQFAMRGSAQVLVRYYEGQ